MTDLIKYPVYDNDNVEVLFVAEIECDRDASTGKKKRMAVQWAIKNGVSLKRANLCYADLRGLDLSGRDFSHSNIGGGKLSGASFAGSILSCTELVNCVAENVDFSAANMNKALLAKANLTGSDMSDANLRYANFKGATIQGAKLRGAQLLHADLSGVKFYGVDAEWADMREANLAGADLIYLDGMHKTDIGGACLDGAKVSIEGRSTWEAYTSNGPKMETIDPDDFRPEWVREHWNWAMEFPSGVKQAVCAVTLGDAIEGYHSLSASMVGVDDEGIYIFKIASDTVKGVDGIASFINDFEAPKLFPSSEIVDIPVTVYLQKDPGAAGDAFFNDVASQVVERSVVGFAQSSPTEDRIEGFCDLCAKGRVFAPRYVVNDMSGRQALDAVSVAVHYAQSAE